jgi:hypothetical protein
MFILKWNWRGSESGISFWKSFYGERDNVTLCLSLSLIRTKKTIRKAWVQDCMSVGSSPSDGFLVSGELGRTSKQEYSILGRRRYLARIGHNLQRVFSLETDRTVIRHVDVSDPSTDSKYNLTSINMFWWEDIPIALCSLGVPWITVQSNIDHRKARMKKCQAKYFS